MMPSSLSRRVGRVRISGNIEGISYLLLLGIAVPLKYGFDQPWAVKILGPIHGILFVFYCLALLHGLIGRRFPFSKAVVAFLASLVPFGTFFTDRWLAGDEAVEAGSRA